MTDPTEVLQAFRAALPAWLRAALELTPASVADLHTAVAAGRDPADLAAYVAYHVEGLDNADQVMRYRLHKAAHPDEEEV